MSLRPDICRMPTVGVGLALTTALISGVAVHLNAFGVRQVPDAAVYTTLKNGVAAVILLAALLALPAARAEIRALRPRDWGGLLTLGLIGGSIPFLLFFGGLAQASAPSAAFIHKTLFVWVALLAVPLLSERLGWLPIAALGALLAGQALVTPPSGIAWGTGETMIAAATLLWSVEVIVARRLLAARSATVVAAGRMGLGLVFLAGYLVVTGRAALVASLGAEAWTWVLVTGVLLAGYVGTWYAALRHAPATVVTSVLVLAAPITGALQAASRGSMPDPTVLAGYGLIAISVLAVARLAGRASRVRAVAATAAA
jgi:drug/metabolite transporter (DMT)-like permease